jgi:NADH:ubiquinone oxidoreductase subunit E
MKRGEIMAAEITITEEKLIKFKERIAYHKQRKGPIMPILHDAQHIFGCIPLKIQKIIAEELNESVAKINGVVTFYLRFTVEPKGKHVIGICSGTACYVRGAQLIIDAVSKELGIASGETTPDGLFTLDTNRCIGACGLAPVFTIGEEVYGNATAQMALDVVSKVREKEKVNEAE